ncbi:hypothetical protein CTA1_2852 [Colletotrichum tanaceti]|uniref:Uncharacterized protein n=1 Tax=Colletotrichum tanaceti TaxID=1306861 RepID=A0A4U6XEU2_9PEZI|nr:hypothetical protein CTA1_2852 [Colletotrichum tanaceti]
MHFTTPSLLLLALLVSTGSSLPTPKGAKFFTLVEASDPYERTHPDQTPARIRVDPVKVLGRVAESSERTGPSLTRRGDASLDPEDRRVDKRSPIRVDPVVVDVEIRRPSLHVVSSSGSQPQSEPGREAAAAAAAAAAVVVAEPKVSEEQAKKKEEATGPGPGPQPESAPKSEYYLPKFRADYDAGTWVHHY